ncbi:hypothetical protein [[Phormidium] sp. ETS-05]|uniref:hypothetical protein n=1 Tax=[Phormidium] sp. ETS-05 TaxID=222819 RepID=UPI0018EEF946|nr:hypothetical protein [[Phormidium] sp. ETS-05]
METPAPQIARVGWHPWQWRLSSNSINLYAALAVSGLIDRTGNILGNIAYQVTIGTVPSYPRRI